MKGLTQAYRNELALMPHILKMEQRGINLNGAALAADSDYYWGVLDEIDDKIHAKLGRIIDVDSNAQLADAIEAGGFSKGFATTATGKRSTAKSSLIEAIADPELLGLLLVRGSTATCLRTFYQPWLVQFNNHGRLYMKWNQIRNYTDTGARTGRLSSSPNLQNIPVEWEKLRAKLKELGFDLNCIREGFDLPSMRKYIVPDPGKIFIGRDYFAQEMRLLAHFAGGILLEELRANPKKDIHMLAANLAGISRKEAKTLGFAVLYGAGVGRIAESLEMSVPEATRIRNEYLRAMPEIKKFAAQLTADSKLGIPVTTLGGRQYYVEAPKQVAGVWRHFEYKLTNYKIQGSAADQTKAAMLAFCKEADEDQELVLTVHDQLVEQVPIANIERGRELLRKAVDGAYADVLKYTIISDESAGLNFAEMVDLETGKPIPQDRVVDALGPQNADWYNAMKGA